jgi:hypothetical protein
MIVTYSNLGRNGEFGNQLFQIAATCSYGLKANRTPIFPKWQCVVSNKIYSDFFKNSIFEDNINYDIQYIEKNFYYNEIPLFENNIVDLKGYFQSEKYFKDFKKNILNLFTPKDLIIKKINNLNFDNSVSVQLRFYDRGYIDPQNVYYSANENSEYLRKAINYFGKNKKYYVTTNNLYKAKNLFGKYDNFIFVDDLGYDNVESFFIQTKCENNIITNSSFGWWGAYLNENEEKKVFAPKNWFRREDEWYNTKDLYCNDWKIL